MARPRKAGERGNRHKGSHDCTSSKNAQWTLTTTGIGAVRPMRAGSYAKWDELWDYRSITRVEYRVE
jgi:hypothetical protein